MELEYPPLIENYLCFCNYRKSLRASGTLNLEKIKWFYPTTLLPLSDLIKPKGVTFKHLPPKDRIARGYFDYITQDDDVHKANDSIPIIKASRLDDSYVDRIYSFIISNEKNESIRTAIKYVIGEIVANIDEHSGCNNSIFMAQSYRKIGYAEITFFDNGVTIPGSFKAAGILKDKMTDLDCIKEAINGVSTKPDAGRGHGLPSTTKILTAMNSDVLIVSGSGAVYLNGTDKYLKGDKTYVLGEDRALDGTLISFRMHLPIKAVDIYKSGYL
jgi:hypothetical protein